MKNENFYNVCYGRIKSPTMPRQTALEFADEIIQKRGESAITDLFVNGKRTGRATRLNFIKEAKKLSN